MNEFLVVENVCYNAGSGGLLSFKKPGKQILTNISFSLDKGKILGIAGESGSGKTTLAKILAGIIPASSGNMYIGKSSKWEKTRVSPVQILFQNNVEILNPLRRIDEIIEEALSLNGCTKKELLAAKIKIFSGVNFSEHLWSRKGFELSGGEQQRAALVRILAVSPELLILDEPFSAQDVESRLNLFTLFKKINKEFGITMICIAHNLNILKNLCDGILIMYKGKIVEKGAAENIFNSPGHPYTKFLLKAENYNLSYDELKSVF
jgi:peptide/nickel transport system ATP-binding protein